jgi:hypothetical protein
MNWDWYTIFSVFSGVVLIAASFLPGQRPKNRAYCFLGGVVMLGYGVYVAQQTNGTYYFPVQIFILPPLLIAYALFQMVQRRKAADAVTKNV